MKRVRLGDVADVIISGIDKKTKENEKTVRLCNFVDVYYNWAITKNMYDGLMTASASDSDIETFILRKGQVAITKDSETRDDIGVAAYIADDFDDVVLGYHCALITPKNDIPEEDRIYGKYLNAILHTKYAQKHFSNNATGSGQRYTLSKEAVEDMIVYLPSPKEQECIGNYLSDIDHKIELNNLINDKLEALAKQIYDYWFVQFDFPNEDGKPYKSSGGKMVWNETLKREIPDGWSEINLFDGLDVLYGYPFATEYFTEEPQYKPVVRIRDILEGKNSTFSSEEVDGKYKLQEEDAVIGMDGNFHINIWHRNDTYLNQRCVRLRVKDGERVTILQAYFAIKPYLKAKEKVTKGSTVGHLSDKDLKKFFLVNPIFTSHFTPHQLIDITKNIVAKRKEVNDLQSLRSYLLPLLMNGQITIKD